MRIIPLTTQARDSKGANAKAIIKYSDLTDTAGLTKTIQLLPTVSGSTLPVGTSVEVVGHNLVTPFDGGATSSLTAQLGDGSTTDRFYDAVQLHLDGTEIDYGHRVDASNAKAVIIDTAVPLNVLFTAVGANLSTLTTGEVELYLRIEDFESFELTQ